MTVEDWKSINEIFDSLSKAVFILKKENKMRQDTIACIDMVYDEACEDIRKRLHTIENFIGQNYKNDIREISERLDKIELIIKEIERFQDITKEQYQFTLNKRRPITEKCQVCNGYGKEFSEHSSYASFISLPQDSLGRYYTPCTSCEGKGFIHGYANEHE